LPRLGIFIGGGIIASIINATISAVILFGHHRLCEEIERAIGEVERCRLLAHSTI
jgi:hypothetical protein